MRKAEAVARDTGIVKIVAPAGWRAFAGLRPKYAAIADGSLDLSLEAPVMQNALGRQGVYR
jgi:hypothetical protein